MSVYDENFEKSDFDFKGINANINMLPPNHDLPKQAVPGFLTYNANKEIPCFQYHAATNKCMNKHGMTREFLEDRNCMVN